MALSSILRYCPLVDITWRCFSLQFCRWQCRRPQNCQPNKKSFEDVFDRFWSSLSSCKDHCLWCDAPNIRWTLSVVSVLRSCRQADEFQIPWELMKIVYLGIHQKNSKDLNRGYGWARWVSRSPSRPFTKLMLMNDTQYWILNSSNWYWTDTESIISVLYIFVL